MIDNVHVTYGDGCVSDIVGLNFDPPDECYGTTTTGETWQLDFEQGLQLLKILKVYHAKIDNETTSDNS